MRDNGLVEWLHIRIDPDTKAKLKALAEADDRNLQDEIRRALRNHVERWPGRRRGNQS